MRKGLIKTSRMIAIERIRLVCALACFEIISLERAWNEILSKDGKKRHYVRRINSSFNLDNEF